MDRADSTRGINYYLLIMVFRMKKMLNFSLLAATRTGTNQKLIRMYGTLPCIPHTYFVNLNIF
jgi:hypothetical protein